MDRGITVCDRWLHSFPNFLADVGERPSQLHELDRIDNDRGYEPGNVRWTSRKAQVRNSRTARMVTFQGKTACIAEWSEILGITPSSIYCRLHAGWSEERALSTPVRHISRSKKH